MDTEELIINMKYDLQRMESDVKKYEYLYISKEEPNPSIIRQYLTCSQSSIIQILHNEDIRENNCNPVKILNMNNQLIEKQCIYNNDVIETVHIYCQTFDSYPQFIHKKDLKQFKNFNENNGGGYCCFKNTYLINHYGNCENELFVPFHTNSVYKVGKCNKFQQQQYVSFKRSNQCVFSLDFMTPCNVPLNHLKNCFSAECDEN